MPQSVYLVGTNCRDRVVVVTERRIKAENIVTYAQRERWFVLMGSLEVAKMLYWSMVGVYVRLQSVKILWPDGGKIQVNRCSTDKTNPDNLDSPKTQIGHWTTCTWYMY
jgi:hypothetical protein